MIYFEKDYESGVSQKPNILKYIMLNLKNECESQKRKHDLQCPFKNGYLQLTVYNHQNGPCYRCLYPKPPPPETVTNCSDGGVLGVGE